MDILTAMAELSAIQPHQGVRLLLSRRQPLTREEAGAMPMVSNHAKRYYYDESRTVVDATTHIGACCKDLASSLTLLSVFRALEDPADPTIKIELVLYEYDQWSMLTTDTCNTCGRQHSIPLPYSPH